jgi:ferritin-like metal-binding protein YciE
MFERFEKPSEAYNFKLGAALTMEKKILDILEENIDATQDEQVKTLLRTHQDETRQHVEVLEQVFGAFEWDIDDSPCPAIDGLEKEGSATVKKTDDSFVDSVILQGAVEIEHHEIGVYTNLILNARAMGRDDVVGLLQANLQSEEEALQKAITLQERVAAVSPKPETARS